MRIDRRRKLPVTTLLYALDGTNTEKLRIEAGDKVLDHSLVRGMSSEEILNYFYDTTTYSFGVKGWKTAFDGERMKGAKLTSDLIDAVTGNVVAETGTKMTPRTAKKLREGGLSEILVTPEDLVGSYVAQDIVNEDSGEIFCEAGDEVTVALLGELEKAGIVELPTLAIDHINVGPYIRNTLAVDKNTSREEALIDIYRVMRPGEPPTLETAEALFKGLFFDSETL